MAIDSMLWYLCCFTEAGVIGLLYYRRIWRILPVFSAFCIWDMLSNICVYAIEHFYPSSYLTAYLVQTALDSVIEFCVLVELTWAVLRPLRGSLPRGSLVAVWGLLLAVGATIWPIPAIPGVENVRAEYHLLIHLQQVVSILRILFFLALAGCSQLLALGWRNRELQVATGLGIYSLTNLVVAVLHTHMRPGAQYSLLNQFVVASYFCSLLYWAVSFAQKEEARREFTPQMQNLLLAVAGAAHSTRVALTESRAGKARKQEKP